MGARERRADSQDLGENGEGGRFPVSAVRLCSLCLRVCLHGCAAPKVSRYRMTEDGTLLVHDNHDSTQFPRSPRRGCRTVRSRGPLGQHTTAGPGRLARERGGHFTLHREASLPTVGDQAISPPPPLPPSPSPLPPSASASPPPLPPRVPPPWPPRMQHRHRARPSRSPSRRGTDASA